MTAKTVFGTYNEINDVNVMKVPIRVVENKGEFSIGFRVRYYQPSMRGGHQNKEKLVTRCE